MKRRYHDLRTAFYPAPTFCEHCDSERSLLVRADRIRGWICPPCDSSLDEMFGARVKP